MQIVEEDLRGCIGRGTCTPDTRYYVIETPINESGICFQFDTKEEAETFLSQEEAKKRTAIKAAEKN